MLADATRATLLRVYSREQDRRDTLYIGVTNDLIRRVFEHRSDGVPGFTKQYGVHKLVHYEIYDDVQFAIQREKRLKKWNRAWKIRLIEENNPNWSYLYPSIARP